MVLKFMSIVSVCTGLIIRLSSEKIQHFEEKTQYFMNTLYFRLYQKITRGVIGCSGWSLGYSVLYNFGSCGNFLVQMLYWAVARTVAWRCGGPWTSQTLDPFRESPRKQMLCMKNHHYVYEASSVCKLLTVTGVKNHPLACQLYKSLSCSRK